MATKQKEDVTQESEGDDAENELAAMVAAAEEGEAIGDDEVEIDLSEAVSFEAITADVPVEIVAAELKKGPKARYIELKLRVFEGEHEKRLFWTNATVSGKGAGIGFDELNAFGADIDRKAPKVSCKALIGLRAVASVAPDKREEYAHKTVVGRIKRYVSEADKEAANLK